MGKGIAIVLSLLIVTSAHAGLGSKICSEYTMADDCDSITTQFYCDKFGIEKELCGNTQVVSVLRMFMQSDPQSLNRVALVSMRFQALSVSKTIEATDYERRGLSDIANLVTEFWIENHSDQVEE